MSHTKGPWVVDKKYPLTIRPTRGVSGHGDCPICNVSIADLGILYGAHGNLSPVFEEAKANANLIAAAPELLEAAEKALSYMRLHKYADKAWADDLESAINKARGA